MYSFQTLFTCEHNENENTDRHVNDFNRYTAFDVSHFAQLLCILGYEVCVITPSYRFLWIRFKYCTHARNIMKMCMWLFCVY